MRALALWLVATAACAHPVHTSYPSEPGESTGVVAIVLPHPVRGVSVAINGTMVASRAHTDEVVVRGVEVGYADVEVVAGMAEKRVRVWVGADERVEIPVPAMEGGGGNGVVNALLSIGSYLLGRAIYQAWLE